MPVTNMSSYDQVGKMEDISAIITTISPTKTPFQSMIGKDTVTNTVFQWQEDALQAAASNAAVESAAAPAASMDPTSMRSNNTQILTKTASASGTSDVVKTYGRDKELAYQLAMKSAELKRDFELALVGVLQAAVVGTTATARRFANVPAMIAQVSTFTMGTGAGINFGGALPTAAAMSETAITSVLQACYTEGAEPDTIMIKPADALVIAAMQASGRTRFVENGTRTIVNAVDFYDSPFGKVKVVLNRFLPTAEAVLFEAAMWKVMTLRPWFRHTLAKVGDSTQVQIVGEFSLKHRHFGASGRIRNLA